VRGDQRGRELGYPTANVECPPHTAIPADGVYAGHLVWRGLDGTTRGSAPAAVSIGTNPTFDGVARTVEAYALDVDVDLYGEVVAVEFVARLRGMEKFDGIDALVAQMGRDVTQTRQLLGVG
jgi:riboflavin kinase/FMN adenylyltransferase